MPFERARAVLECLGGIGLSVSSVWRRMACWGERFAALETCQREAALALPRRGVPLPGEAVVPDKRMGVAMDGAMVPLRTKGWKELKIGCVFEVVTRDRWDASRAEWEATAHGVHNSFVAHLGGPEVFGALVWSEACRRGWEQARDRQVVGDAAAWVWNLAAQHFYDSRQVVDGYHATHHLALAAQLWHGEGSAAAQRWYQQRVLALYQGHAARIGAELCQAARTHPTAGEALQREGKYFCNNHRRMQYLELREEGFVIGSGMVESGCKQFRARFCGPGMRWSRAGIERLILVRAAILSNRFETVWSMVYHPPPN